MLLAAMLLTAAPAAADWRDQLRVAEDHLRADRPAEALAITRGLTDRMVNTLAGDEAARRAFGTILGLRAIAEAGAGLEEDARFHWNFALGLRPELKELDLASFGRGGRNLQGWFAPIPEERDEQRDEERNDDEKREREGDGEDRIVRPRRLRSLKAPEYTRGARAEGVRGQVVLLMVVEKTGGVRDVEVLESLHPGLDYRAAEAARAWRFEPARRDGEPVDAYYKLTINFDLRGIL